jgi:hypothetical protein
VDRYITDLLLPTDPTLGAALAANVVHDGAILDPGEQGERLTRASVGDDDGRECETPPHELSRRTHQLR